MSPLVERVEGESRELISHNTHTNMCTLSYTYVEGEQRIDVHKHYRTHMHT